MACVGRLSGALIVHQQGRYFLVGDLKEPCDFALSGFQPPGDFQVLETKFIDLKRQSDFSFSGSVLYLSDPSDELPKLLAERFLIERNALVSERLWHLVMESSHRLEDGSCDASWLVTIPQPIWQVVRDTVLRCQ